MAKYWYRIKLSKRAKSADVEKLRTELTRLFQSPNFPVENGQTFDVITPLEPVKARAVLEGFCTRHGNASFVLGALL